MRLKEKHKQFVVKSFACFMKLTDIVDAFIEEFEHELPPLGIPEGHPPLIKSWLNRSTTVSSAADPNLSRCTSGKI